MLVYLGVALAQGLACLDHDVGQRNAAAAIYGDAVNIDASAIKYASTSAGGILCGGISACSTGTVVGGLAVLNRQVLENKSDARPSDLKHAIAHVARSQPGGIDNGCIRT